mmetsp:Transcript_26917/g.41034  ORF Transcript_26917/g.41034 Transcript_26917/m.41034 type:complete len:135 (-) Transcript_26917:1140-1544(-)
MSYVNISDSFCLFGGGNYSHPLCQDSYDVALLTSFDCPNKNFVDGYVGLSIPHQILVDHHATDGDMPFVDAIEQANKTVANFTSQSFIQQSYKAGLLSKRVMAIDIYSPTVKADKDKKNMLRFGGIDETKYLKN